MKANSVVTRPKGSASASYPSSALDEEEADCSLVETLKMVRTPSLSDAHCSEAQRRHTKTARGRQDALPAEGSLGCGGRLEDRHAVGIGC